MNRLIPKYNLLLKADDWRNEDEVRIITDEKQEFIHFEDDELVAVILGNNIEQKNESKIVKTAKRNNIEVYKTYLDNLKLKIHILPYEFEYQDIISGGGDYEIELDRWRVDNKEKYSLGIDGQLLDSKIINETI